MRTPEFPPVPGSTAPPEWTGHGFRVNGTLQHVLAYGAGASGWTDDLTSLQERVSGKDLFIDAGSRHHAVREVLKTHDTDDRVILEVGSSSGYLLEDLSRALPRSCVIGSDYTRETLEDVATRLPNIPLLQYDLVACPLPDGCVDAVILLNVLEHIERDDLAMRQLHRILKPNGVAIIEVPAGPGLFDSYDKALMHFRRYRMSGLRRLVRAAGFDVVRASHLAFTIYPAFWAAKKLRQLRPAPEERLDTAVESSVSWSWMFQKLGTTLLELEAAARNVVYLPWGIRCLVTCRKAA